MAGSLAQWFRNVADWIGEDEERARYALETAKTIGRREVKPTPPVDPGST